MGNINTDEYDLDEGGMFISDIHLQAAAWDYENDCLIRTLCKIFLLKINTFYKFKHYMYLVYSSIYR